MYTIAVIATTLSVILATSALPVNNFPHNDFYSFTNSCIPNQRFINQCNDCDCDDNGYSATCTIMFCLPPKQPHIDGFSDTDGLACPPGQKFFDNFNVCTCSNSGKSAVCTLAADKQAAPVARLNYPRLDNFSETGECTPGVTFYEQCNTCTCFSDGKSAGCTIMACPGYDKIRIDNYEQGNKCPAGKTFYDKCNTCKCGADGVSAGCTYMACPIDFE